MKFIWATKDKILVYVEGSATIELGRTVVRDMLSKQTIGESVITKVSAKEFDSVVFQLLKRK